MMQTLHTIKSHLPFLASSILFLLLPLAGHAQTPDISWFGTFFAEIYDVVQFAIPLLLALSVLLFIWGVVQYFILGAGDEGKRTTGRVYMLYALIGLTAIVAVWGLVALVASFIGVGYDASPAPAPAEYFPTFN